MQNPLKRPERNETDQVVSDKPALGTRQIRSCDRCHRELPSDYKYKKCDDCRNRRAKTVTAIGGALAIASLQSKNMGQRSSEEQLKSLRKRDECISKSEIEKDLYFNVLGFSTTNV